MKAIMMHETGGPEVLRPEEVEVPKPGPGQVLVKVAVAGVNFADTGVRRGMFHGPGEAELPLIPGFEVGGTIASLGSGVESFAEGERVVAVLQGGGYAGYAVADEASLVAVPDGVDLLSATALLVQGITAYGVLHDAARLAEGENVLVQAAAGGVGSLAVQLARLAGAGTIIGTAGTPEKRELALSLGADHAVDYGQPDWTDRVLDLTGGRGVDVVLESVGGRIGAAAYACLAPLGRLVTFGAASGEGLEPPDMWQLNLKGQTVAGFGGPWLRPGAAELARKEITRFLQQGQLRVVEGATFDLEGASKAHRAVEERRTLGKVILRVNEE